MPRLLQRRVRRVALASASGLSKAEHTAGQAAELSISAAKFLTKASVNLQKAARLQQVADSGAGEPKELRTAKDDAVRQLRISNQALRKALALANKALKV